MISPEIVDNRIKKLENKIQKWNKKLLNKPNLKGFTSRQVGIIMNRKAEYYEGTQPNLFGEYPIEVKVVEVYSKYRSKYSYKTTARRHTAEDFENLDEQDVKRLINKYERKIVRHNRWKYRKKLVDLKDERNSLHQKTKQIVEHNNQVCGKLHRIKNNQWELVKKKREIQIEEGQEAIVEIDFQGLPATNIKTEMFGPITVLARFITREDFEIARANDRVNVMHGDLEKTLNYCDFKEESSYKPADRERCVECGEYLNYNQIGFNKKIGRQERKDWKCIECLDVDYDYYQKTVEGYKSSGCDMFI